MSKCLLRKAVCSAFRVKWNKFLHGFFFACITNILLITEAVYFAKPMIGISVFFDQHSNMQIAQQRGYAINIPIETLNVKNFQSAVTTIMENSRFANKLLIIYGKYY